MPLGMLARPGEVGELLLSPDLARALKFYDRWLPGALSTDRTNASGTIGKTLPNAPAPMNMPNQVRPAV